jgi:hypothetical protein
VGLAPTFAPAERAVVASLACVARARRGLDASPAEHDLARALAAPGFDAERFYAFAQRHRVVAAVHEALRSHTASPGLEPVRRRARDDARRQLLFAEGSFQQLRALSGSLARAAVPHAAYKGPAFAIQAYGSVGARAFGDLDVLVPRRDLERVVAWANDASYTLPEWDDETQRTWCLAHMHHLSAHRRSPFGDAHLELHWMTLPPMMRPGTPTVDAWLAGPLDDADGVPVLPWPRAYASTVEHHAKHGWSRLLYVLDCAVREVDEQALEPVLADALGRAVLEGARALTEALVAGALLEVAPPLLLATWSANDPYQFEVGEAYLDLLDPRGAWARRLVRFRSLGAVANRKEAVYAFARQVFLEASVARGRVFGPRPNDDAPLLKAIRARFR